MATKKTKADSAAKDMNFEDSLRRLRQISEELEEGEPTLDAAIGLYTEGMQNAKFCREKLGQAEKKIKVLLEENGEMVEKDFQSDE